MKTVIKKNELLTVISANRENHVAMLEESINGYIESTKKRLNSLLEDFKNNRPKSVSISLNPPEDHTADYDRAIKMISMNIGDEIELEEDQFNNLVMDNWNWLSRWVTSNKGYSKTVSDYGSMKGL